MQEWHPDTCKCVVGQVPQEGRWGSISRCDDHQGVPDSKLLVVLLEEARRKNFVLDSLDDPQGWSFDSSRFLHVKLKNPPSISDAQAMIVKVGNSAPKTFPEGHGLMLRKVIFE